MPVEDDRETRTTLTWTDDERAVSGELVNHRVIFDAVEMESPVLEMAITEYPVELGANMIDHVRQKANGFRMVAVVSNSPSRDPSTLTHLDGVVWEDRYTVVSREPRLGSPPFLQIPQSFAGVSLQMTVHHKAKVRNVSRAGRKVQRAEEVYFALRRAMGKAADFTIHSRVLGTFGRMLLKAVRVNRDSTSGNSMRMELEFQQITFAQLINRRVTLPDLLRAVEAKNEGAQQAPKPDKQTAQDTNSIAKDWMDAVKDFLGQGQ
jgi:hypothetical protein